MSYQAVVTKISVRPHPNADRLQLGTCLGNQVVVGLDTKDGELGVFFPTDGQLGHEYCLANDLYSVSARAKLGLPEAAVGATGFIDHNRRVRSQSFRKERSDGLWMPLVSLHWATDETALKVGDAFTELGGYTIAQKYYTPATLRALKGGTKATRTESKCFPKHDDTKQFRFVADQIPEESVLYITEKLHGTSGRYGLVWDSIPVTGWRKFLNSHVFHAGLFKRKEGYAYLNGSRNVIIDDSKPGYYGTNAFRHDVIEGLTLHKGEMLFFEIVGWVSENSPIMPPHAVDKTNLKDIQQKYGNTINYTYGCPNGTHRIYVYKIANVNPDGVVYELPWTQVVTRCRELGLPHVPLLFGPTTLTHLAHIHACDGHEALRRTVEQLTEGESTLSSAQIREGVVVRTESTQGIGHIKNKQFAFGVLEGFWKEKNEEAIDPEEAA